MLKGFCLKFRKSRFRTATTIIIKEPEQSDNQIPGLRNVIMKLEWLSIELTRSDYGDTTKTMQHLSGEIYGLVQRVIEGNEIFSLLDARGQEKLSDRERERLRDEHKKLLPHLYNGVALPK